MFDPTIPPETGFPPSNEELFNGLKIIELFAGLNVLLYKSSYPPPFSSNYSILVFGGGGLKCMLGFTGVLLLILLLLLLLLLGLELVVLLLLGPPISKELFPSNYYDYFKDLAFLLLLLLKSMFIYWGIEEFPPPPPPLCELL